jgi:hypothetical protein
MRRQFPGFATFHNIAFTGMRVWEQKILPRIRKIYPKFWKYVRELLDDL